ncbi:DUF2256 domain-containing protein [Gammaproteobacteria bacterium]|nr:DUF2256 domain-containing protein [Gammaproteobacteria bacterium]
MAHHKQQLPQKACQRCKRQFAWRKKWERDWPNVKYCSERCRRQAKSFPGSCEHALASP